MCNKKIKLNIFCSKMPFELTIMTCDGRIVKKETLYANYKTICVCTKFDCLKLFAKYKNQIVYKKICLSGCRCQNICVNFAFKKVFSKMVFCLITLTDAVYGLPIQKALLQFK